MKHVLYIYCQLCRSLNRTTGNVTVLPKMAMVLTIAVGARLTEGRGERREGRLKGSNHKEQEQRRFVGTLYITPPSPGPLRLLVCLAQNTHSCLFQIFDTKWQNERPRGASSFCRGVLQTKYIRLEIRF